VQQFHPHPSLFTGYFSQAYASSLPAGDFEVGLLINYADDPLDLGLGQGITTAVVSAQLTANVFATYGLTDWFDVGLDIPLILMQDGDDVIDSLSAPDAGFGIGDIRVVPRFVLMDTTDEDRGGAAIALVGDFYIPSGSDDDYQGEGLRGEGRLAFDVASNGWRMGFNVGFMGREEARLGTREVDTAFTYSAAADIPLVENVHLVPELFGEASVAADDPEEEENPWELLLGLKIFPDREMILTLGGGIGLNDGADDWRVFAGFSYASIGPFDRDEDGIFDENDVCPDEPEDFDEYEDDDGCPELDNDGDGILDTDDACALDPEDMDEFEDEDGCPELDNDNDGFLDADDQCPLEPEDVDEFADDDGCPDPDNDSDGVLDVDDQCPMVAEDIDGVEDEDGCPDIDVVIRECEALELGDNVYFDTNSDVIQERSHELLDDLAYALRTNPGITAISIEGHTDDRGREADNQDLSARRAASVVIYLLDAGIEPERMTSAGFGELRPIADNETEEGRAANRRVEVIIVEQEGCGDE